MLKKVSILFFFSCFALISFGQNAVRWSFNVTPEESDSTTYIVEFRANIQDTWHLYSQYLPSPDEGPIPTLFEFDENKNVTLLGKVEEENEKVHSVMDEAFGVKVNYFDGKVVFTQKVKLKSLENTTLSGFISYMVCNDSMCVPNDLDFNIPLGK